MAAAFFVDGEDDEFFRLIELFDQLMNESGADEGVIDQAEQDAVGTRRKSAQRCLDGTELTFFPIFIDDNFIGFEIDGFSDGFRVSAEDNAARADLAMSCCFEKMFEERATLVGEQRLWRAHSARGSAGEDDGGEHVLPFSAP